MKIITLCGSTKFKRQFREAEATLTYQGNIVISLGFFDQSEKIKLTNEQELMLEEMHYHKIDMCDEIFVIDVNEYIGKSTQKEIEYAKNKGKGITYYSMTNLQPIL
ncbi:MULTISPECIES: DUF4406 domain-containing protein [unclassified Sutcliffiella]|uniref:DUF4406 domain-containing protein n=1 Tax=unclassified Sutcliffiella TaxID=2837532 RepID=UPI0030CF373F